MIGEKTIKLLLIEDDPDDILILREILVEAGSRRNFKYELECAESLSEGLSCFGKREFDVVLLDLSLPDSQGLDTLLRVVEKSPGVPIVVMTGLEDDLTAIRAVQQGAQDCLIKGQVDGKLMGRTIYHAIDRQRILKELEHKTRELQSSEAHLRTIIEKNADGIVIVDKEGTTRFVNPAAESLFGHVTDELLGSPFGLPLVAGETAEVDIIRKDRKPAVAEIRVVETEWEGESAILASLRDITERKRAEGELRKLNRDLEQVNRQLKETQASLIQAGRLAGIGQLAAGVAHEINNPAAFVYSNLSSLQEDLSRLRDLYQECRKIMMKTAPPEMIKAFGKKETEAKISYFWEDLPVLMRQSLNGMERIKNIVKNMGHFAGAQQTGMYEVDVNKIIESALDMTFCQIEHKAGLIKSLDEVPRITGNEGKLGQAFLNLIFNAIQAIPEGNKEHNLIKVLSEVSDGRIKITVADTGCGITPEDLPRIYDLFFTTKPVGEGTGLGLAITYEIVRQHGGRIEVASQPGEGSRFEVYLPV